MRSSGLRVQEVTSALARAFGLPRPAGALVSDVYKGGPAGLRRGDVILSVNGEEVGSPERFYAQMAKVSKSGYAALRIQRGAVRLFVPLANP